MPAHTSATTPRACPCTASGAGRTCSSRMEGCPHRNYWRCVQSMRKKLNDLTLTLLNYTTPVYQVQPTSGCSEPVSPLSEPLMSTASRGALEAVELSFRSFTMENQPASGLVEQSMDGSLSTSCPEGQLALIGMDYAEIERRVLSWKMSSVPSECTKQDILAWLYSGQLSPSGRLPSSPEVQSLAGSTATKLAETGT